MTRINLVKPEDLADAHVFAEFREIVRIPSLLRQSLKTKSRTEILQSIPSKFILNTGHVKFFYDKMNFLRNRYISLTGELSDRNYNIQMYDSYEIFLKDIPAEFCNDYKPNADDIKISVERILSKIDEKPEWYKYYGKSTTEGYFKELYKLYLKEFYEKG